MHRWSTAPLPLLHYIGAVYRSPAFVARRRTFNVDLRSFASSAVRRNPQSKKPHTLRERVDLNVKESSSEALAKSRREMRQAIHQELQSRQGTPQSLDVSALLAGSLEGAELDNKALASEGEAAELADSDNASELSEEDLGRIYEDLITPPAPSTSTPREKTSFYNLLVDEASAVEVYDEMRGVDKENLLFVAEEIDNAERRETDEQKASSELEGVEIVTSKSETVNLSALAGKITHACRGQAVDDVTSIFQTTEQQYPEEDLLGLTLMYSVVELHTRVSLEAAEKFLERTLDTQTDKREVHIQALLWASKESAACDLLHSWEKRGAPAALPTYTRVIQGLLRREGPGSARRQDDAWDLFAHMRYVAHPVPDAELYGTMIQACGHRADVDTERALDLFTEMTTHYGIQPSLDAYNGVIRACARGNESQRLAAFQVAKDMIAHHQTPEGTPQIIPDKGTFLSLMMAARGMKDLSRARWILSEALRVDGLLDEPIISNMFMINFFQTSADCRVPWNRARVPLAPPESSAAEVEPAAGKDSGTTSPAIFNPAAGFTPQTKREITKEADKLFQLIEGASPEDPMFQFSPWRGVSSQAVSGAYLYVHLRQQSPAARCKSLYEKLFPPTVLPSSRTVMQVLRWCQTHRGENGKLQHSEFAQQVWDNWFAALSPESAQSPYLLYIPGWLPKRLGLSNEKLRSVSAVEIERVWTEWVRLLTLQGDLDEAMKFVVLFHQRYTPQTITQSMPSVRPSLQTKPGLFIRDTPGLVPSGSGTAGEEIDAPVTSPTAIPGGLQPLVRHTSKAQPRDDALPPFLTFKHVELLHHHLVREQKTKHVAQLKYILKSYEGALLKRRANALGTNPVKKATDVDDID